MIGLLAPCSPLPRVELKKGVERLEEAGLSVQVHRQAYRRDWVFAGTHEERAKAFWEMARDPKIDVIWAGRGGYGALNMLPHIDRLAKKGRPSHRKLLVGFSDVTVLHEFCRRRWAWYGLHAPMVAGVLFEKVKGRDWQTLKSWLGRASVPAPWQNSKLKFLSPAPARGFKGQLVGGNLSVWADSIGTPFEGKTRGKVLFLEEVAETFPKIDRMITHMELAGQFDQVQGLVLGTFEGCADRAPLVQAPGGGKKRLRPTLAPSAALKKIFGELGQRKKFPVVTGLKVGHGELNSPLPLGGEIAISRLGQISLQKWAWLK